MACFSSLAMWWYSIKSRTRKYFKGYGFLSFARKYTKQLNDSTGPHICDKKNGLKWMIYPVICILLTKI